jgi:hypothetical protein
MSRIVPNERSWVAFGTVIPTNLQAPSLVTNLNAVTTKDLTCFTVSITASAQGNTVPTPSICSLFETNIPGTSAATFTADFYRDDLTDTAWLELVRGKPGVFYISRFGGKGVGGKPIAADIIEVWPVIVTSRAASALASNTAQTFTCSCAVTQVPAEAAVVAA